MKSLGLIKEHELGHQEGCIRLNSLVVFYPSESGRRFQNIEKNSMMTSKIL